MGTVDLPAEATGQHIQSLQFPYRRHADQDATAPARHAVVVVGAGPVGLSLAIDLAQRGVRVLLLDNDDRLSTGSRAICFAKRTLEIWDRLGVGDACVAKGVSWNLGRVFLREQQVYQFDLLPEAQQEHTHQRPAFINLQQYYAEAYLLRRVGELPNIEIRWKHAVVDVQAQADGVLIGIDTPDGRHDLLADHVVACDGSRSGVRRAMGLESTGRTFKDRFLIADVRMAADFPAERWFWFDPPFHRNQGVKAVDSTPSSVLLHRQPDGVWRIDFQLGWDADPEVEKQPERIVPRVQAMLRAALGREVPFELEWASVYTFACERMASFRHGRVLFAGDSAHGVSPFGARGANSGVQDADNLAWKLAAVLRGDAPEALLQTYASEREAAADENILNSTRATDFITPKSEVSRMFRNAVLELAAEHPFARRLVNSGRLSVPTVLHGSPLNTPDRDGFGGAVRLGAPASDAPLTRGGEASWLLRELGDGFALLAYGPCWPAALADAPQRRVLVLPRGSPAVAAPGVHAVQDAAGCFAERYDAQPGSTWLLRPDRHLCARWRAATADDVGAAHARALGQPPEPACRH